MKIERNGLLAILSEALDSVEKEVLGVESHHALRVAWLCLQMGKQRNMEKEELSQLVISALLHDSALNEYHEDYENGMLKPGVSGRAHCAAGEKNLRLIPGAKKDTDFVLYHHETADGLGPFKKTENETPMGAQLVHIADEMDLTFSFGSFSEETLPLARSYVEQNRGKRYGMEAADRFLEIFDAACMKRLSDADVGGLMQDLPLAPMDISGEEMYRLAELFGRIIDYKSPFTKNHSLGVAQKAQAMGEFYGYEKETAAKLYLAGALHDIGKLNVSGTVLEKPGRLNQEEYRHIQSHAAQTWHMLSRITGFEEIVPWASYHHEKLNGTGYPFGKTAQELTKIERIFACLDIYQALTEDRPYKAGMSHGKAMGILRELVQKGELDRDITEDIGQVFAGEDNGSQEEPSALFQCSVCGYIQAAAVIENFTCPVCGQTETAFVRIL